MNDRNLHDIDFEIKGFDNTVKKTARSLASGFPTIIAALSIIILAALVWTDITISDLFSLRFIGEGMVLTLIFWMMYLSMNENGVRSGKNDEGYIKAKAKYLAARDALREEGISSLSEFCEWYIEDELIRARKNILLRRGVTYEMFTEYFLPISELLLAKDKEYRALKKTASADDLARIEVYNSLSMLKRSAVIIALKIKPIQLTPDMLLVDEHGRVSRNPIAASISQAHARRNAVGLGCIAATSMMIVSVALNVAAEPTKARVIYGLIQIASLIFTGLRGYSAGVLLYSVDAVAFHESRTNVLYVFRDWYNNHLRDYDFESVIEEGGEDNALCEDGIICECNAIKEGV